jgi:hypothetical protein
MTTHTWEWWYRFASEVLGLDEPEAREYADRRALEDANRERNGGLSVAQRSTPAVRR